MAKRARNIDYNVCERCDQMIQEVNVEMHQKFCPYKLVKHRACGQIMPLALLDQHKLTCLQTSIPIHSKRNRVALLIGVNTYERAPLHGAENDVTHLAAMYRQLGFQTMTLKSPNKVEYQATKQSFLDLLDKNTIAVFHFSGHGGSAWNCDMHTRKNFLYLSDTQVIDVQKLVQDITQRNPLFSFITIDACRSGENNLLQMDMQNTLTMLATAPNSSAYETLGPDEKPWGIFSMCLHDMLKTYGFTEDIRKIANRVQTRLKNVSATQFPSVVSNIASVSDVDSDRDGRLGNPDLLY